MVTEEGNRFGPKGLFCHAAEWPNKFGKSQKKFFELIVSIRVTENALDFDQRVNLSFRSTTLTLRFSLNFKTLTK